MNKFTGFSIIVLVLASSVYLLKSQSAVSKSSPPWERIVKLYKPAVADNEKINQRLISSSLKPEHKKVFEGKDISSDPQKVTEVVEPALDYINEKEDTGLLAVAPYRELELYNLNTGEEINVIFWVDGEFVPESIDELDRFMRDWRRNKVIDIDRDLYVLLYDLNEKVDGDAPIHLISGHRSKVTNDKLRAMGRNTAKKSQHVLGKAADIRIPGVTTKELRNAALGMKRGGVGYYPKSGFVHVDTGRVRRW